MSSKKFWERLFMPSNVDRALISEKARALAESGDLDAIMLLVEYYENEEKDLNKVVSLLQRAAELGSSDAMLKLFPYYEDGNIVEADHNMCYKLASTAFENGSLNDRAGFALGRCYLDGIGTAVDPLKAIEYLSISLSEHDAYEVAGLYYDKAKNMLDKQTYISWLTKKSEEIPYCKYRIGKMYEEGDVFPENKMTAVSFYLQAAEKGCVDGKMSAAILLSNIGNQNDKAIAEKIFIEIINSKYSYEHKRAKNCLGLLYKESGRNNEAIRVFEDVYRTYNDGQACAMIGNIYGEYQNLIEAKRWYELAYNITGDERIKEIILLADNAIRSSTEISKKSSGCYIATAIYGSYDCPQVWTLRRYRDNTLDSTWCGRIFIKLYYLISPTIVKCFGKASFFRKIFKSRLDKLVERLNNEGVENTPYCDKNF